MIGAAINLFMVVIWLILGMAFFANPIAFSVAIIINIFGAAVCLMIDAMN